MDHARTQYDDPLLSWRPQEPCKPVAETAQPACLAVAAADSSDPSDQTDPSDHLPADFAPIWDVLEHHRGQENAITAPRIADSASLYQDLAPANRGTKVRKILELSQDAWPWPVCGDSDGYYLAETPDELAHAYAALSSRAMCIFRRRRSLRRAAQRAGFTHLGHGRWQETKGGQALTNPVR